MTYSQEDALLLLQPDRALRADRLHGRPGLYAAAGLGREAIAGWVRRQAWSRPFRA